MALVKGTNCGFVTVAPSADPAETGTAVSQVAKALKDTSPVGNNVITEMGWYSTGAQSFYFDLGIYDHNAGDDNPENLIGSDTGAKGITAGWRRITGLNIPLTASTTYWLGFQVDNNAGVTIDTAADGGEKIDNLNFANSLPDPWGVSDTTEGKLIAVYAKVEEAVSATQEFTPYVY